MGVKAVLSRPILRSIYYCAGARWHSLRKLGITLEAFPQKTKPAQVALAISRRAQRRHDRTVECTPLPQHLAKAELNIEIGFQHLTYSEHFILLKQEERAHYHSKKFLESLLAAARETGKPITQEDMPLIEPQYKLFNNRFQSQMELEQAISDGKLSAKITFVLGMHRSGTSALGGILCQGGLDAPLDLMPPTERNLRGYWESYGIYLINERYLNQLGTSWQGIDLLPLGWEDLPQTSAWRKELLCHLKKVFYQATHPMIKDPRFCILLPGITPWLESDLLALSFILPIRHPFEVASSLQKAEGVSVDYGIRLWLRHVFSSERLSRGYPRYIVQFEEILSDPKEVMKRCRAVTAQTKADHVMDYSLTIDQSLKHQHIESLRADIERSTVRMGTERQIASQLFDLLATSDGSEPLIATLVDDLYCLWQTIV